MASVKEDVLAALGALGIPYELLEHAPVHTMEDCGSAFVLACAWLALAGLTAGESAGVERFTAGSVTIQEGGGADAAERSAALRLQAETVLGPYLADRGFAFQGVEG